MWRSVAMGDASDDDAAVEPMHLVYPATGAPDSGALDGDGDAAVAHVPESQGLDWIRDMPATQGPSQAVPVDEPEEAEVPAAAEPTPPVDAAVAPVPESQGLGWLEDLPTQGPAQAVEQDEPEEGAAVAAAAAHTAPVDAPVAGDACAPAPAPGAGDPHLQQGDGSQEGVPLGAGVSFPPQGGSSLIHMQTAYALAGACLPTVHRVCVH